MNIVVGSAFRDAAHYVNRYMNQVHLLAEHAGTAHHVRVAAVEGDSRDCTRQMLMQETIRRGLDTVIVTHHHGLRQFGSTEEPDRLRALSAVGNAIFDEVSEADDVLVYVESDLIWDPHTIGSLIDMAIRRDGGFDIFAPLIFAGPFFYDIWGFRKNGERFVPFPPYHIGLEEGLTEVDSVGSCLIMRGEVARKVRIRNDYCLVGWCEEARAQGFKIAVQPQYRIQHPA